ncbi:YeeE/YedE family protein [Aestuariivirga litoralis]|nr:YeeE/YedE family protein [Aestuariivirga litoralis]
MMRLSVLISGVLFGVGLAVSGMVNPAKILNFLDLTGNFDPTLIFVMGGGLLTALIGYRFVLKRKRPLFEDRFHLPTAKDIDLKLVGGSALFGLGWGITGFCPGPALASLVYGQWQSIVFVIAMAAGALLAKLVPQQN